MSKMKIIMSNWRAFKKAGAVHEQMAAGQEKMMMDFLDNLKKMNGADFALLPLHVRGFGSFLLGRTKKWTEKT